MSDVFDRCLYCGTGLLCEPATPQFCDSECERKYAEKHVQRAAKRALWAARWRIFWERFRVRGSGGGARHARRPPC